MTRLQSKHFLRPYQVRDEFFDLIDKMITRLFERGQNPDDETVFPWRTFNEIPASNLYNMDEMGSDTNKGRKKKIGGARPCFPLHTAAWQLSPDGFMLKPLKYVPRSS